MSIKESRALFAIALSSSICRLASVFLHLRVPGELGLLFESSGSAYPFLTLFDPGALSSAP
jgi:hypothetical protein